MPKENDREHFEDYRDQTRVKHEILAAYLPAYFHILKKGNRNLLFIDGFAGRGTYTSASTGESVDGSPLRALKLIAESKDFTDRVSAIFIESDPVLFLQLEQTVNDFYSTHHEIRKPVTMLGTFAARMTEIMAAVRGNLAPTFLFVDPCGVSGTKFTSIRDVMSCEKCEAFIFFNVDGVRRIAGLDTLSDVLIDLMGSHSRAQALYDAFRSAPSVSERENLILDHYRTALRTDIGAKYTVAFRVEQEDQQRTSHYLIHATKHPLGFKIMKDVMWRYGHSDDRAGGLQFEQASRTNFVPLFDFSGDEIKQSIMNALRNGHLKVSVFCDEWVCRADDLLCETAYKKAILELEAAGNVVVLAKDGKNLAPASERPKRKGKPTLANDYYLRIAEAANE
jgi:three-Cys-motif partner protein